MMEVYRDYHLWAIYDLVDEAFIRINDRDNLEAADDVEGVAYGYPLKYALSCLWNHISADCDPESRLHKNSDYVLLPDIGDGFSWTHAHTIEDAEYGLGYRDG